MCRATVVLLTQLHESMNLLIALIALGGIAFDTPPDTITVMALPAAPTMDGRVGDREYGDQPIRIQAGGGDAHVWVARHGGFIYIAATLPDSTFYWGDDFVVSLDADGSADASPQPGDRQWYLRRTLDSSVVFAAVTGSWNTPGQQPPMLGSTRHDADWDVASASSRTGWSVELRVRDGVLAASGGALPRLAFRTYNNGPNGWWSWPEPPAGTPAQRVERSPEFWVPLRRAP
jgi:hypothetical protein